jgi:hypothetical protein
MSLFPYVVIAEGIHRDADAVDADMGLQPTDAIKFCFRKSFAADVRTLKRVNRGCSYKKDLLVLKRTAAYLPEDSKQE